MSLPGTYILLNKPSSQCSCLENPRDRGAWWAAVSGVTQSRTRLKWLSSSSKQIGLSKFTLLLYTPKPEIDTSQWRLFVWTPMVIKYTLCFFSSWILSVEQECPESLREHSYFKAFRLFPNTSLEDLAFTLVFWLLAFPLSQWELLLSDATL